MQFGRTALYKLRYHNRLQVKGALGYIRNSRIKIRDNGRVNLGKGFVFKPGVYLAAVKNGVITIESGVSINRNSVIVCHEAVTIGKGCSIGPNVLMYDHNHRFGSEGIESGYRTAPIIIEDNCWLGAGVILLCGAHIGEGCVIGAGTVVGGTIPPHSLVTMDRTLVVSPLEKHERGENK